MFWKFFNQWLDLFIDGSYADTWASFGAAFLPIAVIIFVIYWFHQMWEEGFLLYFFVMSVSTVGSISSALYISKGGGPFWLSIISLFVFLAVGYRIADYFNARK